MGVILEKHNQQNGNGIIITFNKVAIYGRTQGLV